MASSAPESKPVSHFSLQGQHGHQNFDVWIRFLQKSFRRFKGERHNSTYSECTNELYNHSAQHVPRGRGIHDLVDR